MSNSSLGEYGDISTLNYLKQLEFCDTNITTKTLLKATQHKDNAICH